MKHLDLKSNSQELQKLGHTCIHNGLQAKELEIIYFELKKILLTNSVNIQADLEKNVESYGQGWTFQENLWRSSSRLRHILLKGTLAQIATYLLSYMHDPPFKIGLLRDQTYFKSPGSELTPWHQDGTFLPLPDIKSLTFWVPFSRIDSTMSPMHYVNRSHLRCWLGPSENTQDSHNMVTSFDYFSTLLDEFRRSQFGLTVYDDLIPGDILVHDSWTLHGSPIHTGSSSRLAIVVVYYIIQGSVELIPSIRLNNPVNSNQAYSLRELNLRDLFPSMNGKSLSGSNPRTPLLLCGYKKGTTIDTEQLNY